MIPVPPTTYLTFHLVVLVPVLVVLGALCWHRDVAADKRGLWSGLAVLVVLAILYTTPWDNYLIERGVWWYGDGVTWTRLWAAPAGEYLFFALQPILTTLFLAQLSIPTDTDLALSRAARLRGVLGGLAVSTLGVTLLFVGSSTLYLGAILAWAGPILTVQWAFGWTQLWRARRTVVLAVGVPTGYLWAADWLALSLGLWSIADQYTVGVSLAGLPVEEATFFFVTNLFVVQGLVLYIWLLDQWPTGAVWPWLAGGWHRPDTDQQPTSDD